jgi:2-methylcitrate dehydratase PrpD
VTSVDARVEEPVEAGQTIALGRFVAELAPEHVPESVRHEAKRALVDHLAVSFAGAAEPGSAKLRRVAARLASSDEATITGSRQRTSAPFAALLNGYASHVLDFDDTYNPSRTTIHGSSSVWPVVFALSETTPLSGTEAVVAFVAGFETEARVANAAGPAHYDIGWHVTGTAGHVGAAAAAAKVLDLPAEHTVHALGAAATQAAGLKEVYGSDCKALHPGKSAMDGLLAGVLASEGFTSRPTALEGKRGLLRLVSTDPDPELLVEGFHSLWHLAKTGYKAYPSGSLTHPTIDAILELCAAHDVDPDQVAYVDASVHHYAATVTGNSSPATTNEAKFSLVHCAAVALLRRRLAPADFADEVVNDPTVRDLRSRVRVTVDPGVSKRGAAVTLRLRDGRSLERTVRANRGTPDNPLRDEDLERKFLAGAVDVVGAAEARRMLEQCWSLEQLDDMSVLVRAGAGTA